MGFTAVQGPNTYGSGCMPGCKRQFDWWMRNYDAGTLGCYNPASMGGRSLHAEGRAMDIALNARDPQERDRGDAILHRAVNQHEQFGTQEILWRGFIWSYSRRGEGIRFGVQQADHMNHVHLGIDVNAARNWDESWVTGGPPSFEEDPLAKFDEKDLVRLAMWGTNESIKQTPEVADRLTTFAKWGVGEALKDPAVQLILARTILDSLASPEGQQVIREAVRSDG